MLPHASSLSHCTHACPATASYTSATPDFHLRNYFTLSLLTSSGDRYNLYTYITLHYYNLKGIFLQCSLEQITTGSEAVQLNWTKGF